MTSRLTTVKQLAPFTHYIVVNTEGGYMLRTLTMDDTQSLNTNTILSDMGKTVVINGYIYRKVQVATVNGVISSGNQTGYICLNSDSAPLFDGADQGVSKLN